ncbi:hypothetical protein BH11BAC5_BH11BAC5_54790 [soil metagenome]|jgi:hypothetical protein
MKNIELHFVIFKGKFYKQYFNESRLSIFDILLSLIALKACLVL